MPARPQSDRYDEPESDVLTLDPDPEPEGPSEGTFWQAYNQHLELPTATLLSVFAHLALVAGLVGVILLAMYTRAKDTTPVPIALVDNGPDENGKGNPNDGGEPNPIVGGTTAPAKTDYDQLPQLDQLPEIKDRIQKDIALDPSLADVTVPDEKVAPIAGLAQELQDKLAQIGKQKGAGGTGAAGVGGTGADSTRARSLRWVMRFQITSGREYLNQLSALGAIVVIPVPPANKTAYVYKDLSGNARGELMTEEGWTQLAQKIQFCDYKRDVVDQVTKELRAPVQTPHAFWAFFPKSLEDKLSAMEKSYGNKRSEDIEETVFQVALRNGQWDMVVVRQTLKR